MNAYRTQSIAVMVILVLALAGCGDSDQLDIVVERGPVIDATVMDTAGNVAAPIIAGQNYYAFDTAPTYPIIVVEGWIDTNGNLEMDEEDVLLDLPLLSYAKVVTPITTYLSHPDETIRNQRKETLLRDMNIADEEALFMLPSQAGSEVIALNNALFKTMKDANSIYLDEPHYHALQTTYMEYKRYIDQDPSKATPFEIAACAEAITMDELKASGKIQHLDAESMVFFQEKRQGIPEDPITQEPPPPANNPPWDIECDDTEPIICDFGGHLQIVSECACLNNAGFVQYY